MSMNIFIGFGYNDNDKWIKDLVFPLIQCFDGTVVTGEDLHGQVIAQAVEERIKDADGVLAFMTRRDPMASGKFTTHRWVTDELNTAIANRIPAVEIRDAGVDAQGGSPGDRQRIEFDLNQKEVLLIELARVLAAWRKKSNTKRLLLLPRDIVQEARPHISNGGLSCTYRFMVRSRESPVYHTRPFRFGQALCMDVRNIPSEDALIQINIQGPQFSWSSDYESVQLLSINLQRD